MQAGVTLRTEAVYEAPRVNHSWRGQAGAGRWPDMEQVDQQSMNRRDWLLSVIRWDGCLPLLVAIAPAVVPFVIPGRDLAELTAVILVPIIAALVRAHHGYCQLEKYGGRATLGRQL